MKNADGILAVSFVLIVMIMLKMHPFYGLIVLACGLWCSEIAKKNHRNKSLAFVIGALFGFVAVIGYYIAGEKNGTKKRS